MESEYDIEFEKLYYELKKQQEKINNTIAKLEDILKELKGEEE